MYVTPSIALVADDKVFGFVKEADGAQSTIYVLDALESIRVSMYESIWVTIEKTPPSLPPCAWKLPEPFPVDWLNSLSEECFPEF